MLLVSVFDSASGLFSAPMLVPSAAFAVRSFSDEVNRPESPMFSHADDYRLVSLGEFDDRKGTLSGDQATLVRGKDVKSV